MIERSTESQSIEERMYGSPIRFAWGSDAALDFYPESGILCKRFHTNDQQEASQLALREFDRLQRYTEALRHQPYLTCPEPILVEPDNGALYMTHCPGRQLLAILTQSPHELVAHIDHIARLLSTALEIYVAEFDEPYFDLAPNNMIFECNTQTLCMLDFTVPKVLRETEYATCPFETSLGSFIGYAVYYTVRPATFTTRQYWKQQKRLLEELIRQVNTIRPLDLLTVRRVSDNAYWSVANRGTRARKTWYSTIGRTLYYHRSKAVLAILEDRIEELE